KWIDPHLVHTLFPYTTLFRSDVERGGEPARDGQAHLAEPDQADGGGFHGSPSDVDQDLIVNGSRTSSDRSTSTFLVRRYSSIASDRKSTRLNSSHVKISYAVF